MVRTTRKRTAAAVTIGNKKNEDEETTSRKTKKEILKEASSVSKQEKLAMQKDDDDDNVLNMRVKKGAPTKKKGAAKETKAKTRTEIPVESLLTSDDESPAKIDSDDEDFVMKGPKKKSFEKNKQAVASGKKNKVEDTFDQFTSSSEDEKSVTAVGDEDEDDVDYAFAPQSLKSVISNVQASLRRRKEISEEELEKRYQNDPIAMKLAMLRSPNKKRDVGKMPGKHTKDVRKGFGASKHGSSGASSSSTVATSTYTNGAGSSSLLDRPVTESQLAMADLDTDTELDPEDEEPRAGTSRGRAARNARGNRTNARGGGNECVTISDDDDELERQFKKFLKESDRRPVDSPSKSSDSGDVILDTSISSFRPTSASVGIIDLGGPDFDDPLRIRVRFRGKIEEIEGYRNWDVEQVRSRLGQKAQLPQNELLLYTENGIKMVDGKTLADYDVDEGDFLEAVRRGSSDQKSSSPEQVREGIRLKFQKAGQRKPVILTVPKYKTMKEIRTILASELQMSEVKLSFKCDGDVVPLGDTPEDLDFEDDYIIDVYEQ